MEKIHGESLLEKDWSEEEKIEIASQIEKELLSLLEYFKNKYRDKSEFLMDIARARQFMYGIKKGDETPKVYMVDIEAYPSENHHSLIIELGHLYHAFKELGDYLQTKFPDFEKKFAEFISELPEKDRQDTIFDDRGVIF